MPEHHATAPVELRTRDVRRAFGGRTVLDGISIDIHAGEIIAIVGASGSGKTVFLDHLIGLLTPDSGEILAADHDAPVGPDGAPPLVDINTLDEDALDRIRLRWATVFQRNALFSGSVRENIAILLREHGQFTDRQLEDRARAALQAASLDPEDVLDKDRDALSGGMAKRVAIARAIAMDPLVIFYDEPTTGLDPIVSGHIHELVWRLHGLTVGALFTDNAMPMLSSGSVRTSIIVTHDKELLRRIRPRVVMLDEGKVCYDGPYDKFGGPDCPPAQQYLQAMPVLHAARHMRK